jgi:polysaccharide deacetylase family protein (PEP-CTERM system associated)
MRQERNPAAPSLRSVEAEMTGPGSDQPPAVMSIDVEDWFHVENLSPAVPRETWSERQLRVERNMDRMLQLMADAPGRPVRASCFVLGWVAERCPALIRRIAAAGHEIASHGQAHELVGSLSPERFRADIERSKALLEDLVGAEVCGYRAPSFSITEWAIPVLQEAGFRYDSSVFATVAHDRYGRIPGLRPDEPIVELAPGFHEIAVSCLTVASRGLPWGGGGYFRLMPYSLFRRGVGRILRAGQPYVFYIHPWEIDPDQPRVRGLPASYRFRHYVGLRRCESRFESLLADFQWSAISDVLDGRASAAAAP